MADARIAFQCETCGKRLRAPASKAGAETTCPQCGDSVRVPLHWFSTDREADDDLLGTFRGPHELACPVCGADVGERAAACPACGEFLGGMGDDPSGLRRSGSTAVTLGSVTAASFESWKEHFGILLASLLLAWLVSTALTFALYSGMLAMFFGGAAILGGAGGGGEEVAALMIVMAVVGGVTVAAAIIAANCWMTLGLAGLHLEAVRDRPDLGTLFRSPGIWRMALCGIILCFFSYVLAALPFFGGAMLLFGFNGPGGGPMNGGNVVLMLSLYLVPTAVFGGAFMLFWPVPFLCLDRPDLGHVKPIWGALTLPSGSWGGHLAIGATAYGLLLAGGMACGIGLLFVGPFVGLMLAHTYDRYDRAELDAHGPRELDPEGML